MYARTVTVLPIVLRKLPDPLRNIPLPNAPNTDVHTISGRFSTVFFRSSDRLVNPLFFRYTRRDVFKKNDSFRRRTVAITPGRYPKCSVQQERRTFTWPDGRDNRNGRTRGRPIYDPPSDRTAGGAGGGNGRFAKKVRVARKKPLGASTRRGTDIITNKNNNE